MRSPTLLDVAHALRAATEAFPGFGWHTSPGGVPGSRYYLDRSTSTLYLDGSLDGQNAFAAFIEGVDDLLSGGADVIPLQRHLVAAAYNGTATLTALMGG